MEDGTVGNETKARAEAFFDTGADTATQDQGEGGWGGLPSSTSSAGTVAVKGPATTTRSGQEGVNSTQALTGIGTGPNAPAAGGGSKAVDTWMFGDGSE